MMEPKMAVKRDGKVGLTYMKSFEIEQRIRREGREEGFIEGKEEGREEGREEGLIKGKTTGLAEAVLALLDSLGDIPSSLRDRITTQADEAVLRMWLKQAAKAESVEAFEAGMGSVESGL